jgi:hypothetical protein
MIVITLGVHVITTVATKSQPMLELQLELELVAERRAPPTSNSHWHSQ